MVRAAPERPVSPVVIWSQRSILWSGVVAGQLRLWAADSPVHHETREAVDQGDNERGGFASKAPAET